MNKQNQINQEQLEAKLVKRTNKNINLKQIDQLIIWIHNVDYLNNLRQKQISYLAEKQVKENNRFPEEEALRLIKHLIEEALEDYIKYYSEVDKSIILPLRRVNQLTKEAAARRILKEEIETNEIEDKVKELKERERKTNQENKTEEEEEGYLSSK
jgi:hypothetical protein